MYISQQELVEPSDLFKECPICSGKVTQKLKENAKCTKCGAEFVEQEKPITITQAYKVEIKK